MFHDAVRKFRSALLFTVIFGLSYSIMALIFKLLSLEPSFVFGVFVAVLVGGFIFGWLVHFHEPDFRNGAR